jgi:primosomal protein N'
MDLMQSRQLIQQLAANIDYVQLELVVLAAAAELATEHFRATYMTLQQLVQLAAQSAATAAVVK